MAYWRSDSSIPFAGGVDADLGIAVGNLFDGDDDFHGEGLTSILTVCLGTGFAAGKTARGELGDVEELRGGVSLGGEGVAEHGVAEGAGGGYGRRAGGDEFGGADVADAFAGFFAEESEAAAGAAAEAALMIARGFDQFAGESCNGAGFVVDVAIAAEVAGIVEDDFFCSLKVRELIDPRSPKARDRGHPAAYGRSGRGIRCGARSRAACRTPSSLPGWCGRSAGRW